MTVTQKTVQQPRFFCSNCEREVFLQSRFCDKCGGEIEWPKEIQKILASWKNEKGKPTK